MIKRETVTSLLVGLLVGACGIFPAVAGSGFDFGPAQGAASGGGGSGDIEGVTAGNGLTGGGASGSVTLNVAVSAGLTANADEITLDEELQDVAGVTPTADQFLGGTGSALAMRTAAQVLTSLGIGAGADLTEVAETGDALVVASGTGPIPSLSAHADLENLVDTAAVDASGNVTLASNANLTLAGTGVLRWADVGLYQFNSTTLRASIDGGTTDFNLWVSQLRATAGSETSVAVAFDLDANTGYYGNADTDLWSSIGGTKTSKLTTSIFDIGPKVLAFGTAVETNTATIRAGADTPEGAISANVGSIFLRTNGGSATSAYVKESGTGNTGWSAIGGAGGGGWDGTTSVAMTGSVSLTGDGDQMSEGIRRRVYTYTGGLGAATTLSRGQSGSIICNTGGTEEVYVNLPTLDGAEDVGLVYTFDCSAASAGSYGLRFVAASGDTITVGTDTSASAGYVRTTIVGSVVTIYANSTSNWRAVSGSLGPWEVN